MFPTFNAENLRVALRYISTAAGGYFINEGLASQSSWEFWSGVVIAAIAAGYGQYKTTTEQMTKTTNALPGVLGVAVTQELDNKLPNTTTITVPEKLVQAIRVEQVVNG